MKFRKLKEFEYKRKDNRPIKYIIPKDDGSQNK